MCESPVICDLDIVADALFHGTSGSSTGLHWCFHWYFTKLGFVRYDKTNMPCQCGYPDGMSPLGRMVFPLAPPSGKTILPRETFHQDTHTGMAYLYNAEWLGNALVRCTYFWPPLTTKHAQPRTKSLVQQMLMRRHDYSSRKNCHANVFYVQKKDKLSASLWVNFNAV